MPALENAFTLPLTQQANWFDEVVAQLRADEVQLEMQTAKQEKVEHYKVLIHGSPEQVLLTQQQAVTRHFVARMLFDFYSAARPHFPRINRIAAAANDAEILMWVELIEDDDLLENQLIDIEARLNAQYHELGYELDMMIVEREDKLVVPSHYSLIHEVDGQVSCAA